jgi:hypothetical protein
MNSSQSTKELFSALAKAQGEISNPITNALNPHFKSKYATLGEVLNTLRPVLPRYGIAVVQPITTSEGRTHLETIITHESGEFLSFGNYSCPTSKDGQAQGIGSDSTYLRRYQLCAIFAIAQEDFDGEIPPAEVEAGILQKLRDASLLGKKSFDAAWQSIPKSDAKDKVWNANKAALMSACKKVDVDAQKIIDEMEKESIDIEIEIAKEQE